MTNKKDLEYSMLEISLPSVMCRTSLSAAMKSEVETQ